MISEPLPPARKPMGEVEFAGADFSRMSIEPAHAHLARINFKGFIRHVREKPLSIKGALEQRLQKRAPLVEPASRQ